MVMGGLSGYGYVSGMVFFSITGEFGRDEDGKNNACNTVITQLESGFGRFFLSLAKLQRIPVILQAI